MTCDRSEVNSITDDGISWSFCGSAFEIPCSTIFYSISSCTLAQSKSKPKTATEPQIEHGETPDGMGILEVDSDRPDILRLEMSLLADEFSLFSGFAFRFGFHDRLLGC